MNCEERERWVAEVGAVGEELPGLNIASCLCRERLWQSNRVVVSASRIDPEPSPA